MIVLEATIPHSGVPSLYNGSTSKWIHDAKGKADHLADVFKSRFSLPDDDPFGGGVGGSGGGGLFSDESGDDSDDGSDVEINA